MLLAFPFFLAALYVPFPAAWFFMFVAIFFAFLNTGPSNTALANVARPSVRATAFALNILVIHLFGDVAAFPIIGYIGGHTNMNVAFLVVGFMMLLAGIIWMIGTRFLGADTEAVERAHCLTSGSTPARRGGRRNGALVPVPPPLPACGLLSSAVRLATSTSRRDTIAFRGNGAIP